MDQPQNEIADLRKRLALLEAENRELKLSNRIYDAIFEDVSVGIGVVTVDGRIFTGNQRICEIWGYSESEFLQKKLEDVIHPDELAGVRRLLERMAKGEMDTYAREGRYIRKNGDVMWLNASLAAVRGQKGELTHIVAVFVDISERKDMEEAIKLEKERLRTIISNSPDHIMMLDTRGVISYLSRPFGEFTPETMPGRSLVEISPPESRDKVRRCLDDAVNHLKPGRFTLSVSLPRGGRYHFEIRMAPVEADGKAVSLVVSASDITKATEAVAKLEKSEERFRLISENIQDMVCLHDTETRVLYASPATAKKMGYDQKELIGRPATDLIHPEDLSSQARDVVTRVMSGEADTFLHCRLKHKDGHYIWVETLSLPLFDQNSEVYQVLTSSRDITRRKTAEEALLQMAYGVSHNFNNILMAVLSNTQAAQSLCKNSRAEALPEAARAAGLLENVIRAADSGRNLVKRLYSHAAGLKHDTSSREVLDVASLLREAASLVRGTWKQFEQGTHRLSLSAEPGLKVLGTRGELSEVLLNLVKNAVEASPVSGAINLIARQDGDKVEVAVEDRGVGLDSCLKDQIFNPFISSKGGRGLGLGLTMSRLVVESFGGTISAHDRAGGGARFVIRLPAQQGAGQSPPPNSEHAKAGGEKVLLVEDESLVAAGIRAILERSGFEVLLASDVDQALAQLKNENPRAVLCDLGLPGGSGWDVMAKAVQKDDPPGVIILTGWAGASVAAVPENLPKPQAILSKPLNRWDLIREVGRAVRKQPRP